jgi:hypothetical protein
LYTVIVYALVKTIVTNNTVDPYSYYGNGNEEKDFKQKYTAEVVNEIREFGEWSLATTRQ